MNDPLNISIPLAGVKTTIPTLPQQDVQLQCVESSVGPNKKETGSNWNLKFVTTTELTATDGRPVAPNFPVYHVIALQASEEAKDPQGYLRGIAEAVDALFGTDESSRPDLSRQVIEDAIGKVVTATVYPDEYPKGSGNFNTKIRRLKKGA